MDFHEKQRQLSDRIEKGELRVVFLDPDGSYDGWLSVVVEAPTGVAYQTQCAGVGNDLRQVEGYLVPVNGAQFDTEEGWLTIPPFTAVFHEGTSCFYDWIGHELPAQRLDQLCALVREVPYWQNPPSGDTTRNRLEFDHTRLEEVCEGWIPVITPDGPGVLVFKNCD
jgi:hypothetical protein